MTDSISTKDYYKHLKSEAKEASESILMNVMDQRGRDFSEYKEEVLDWSWDSIMSE